MRKLNLDLSKVMNIVMFLGLVVAVVGITFFYTFPFNVAEFKKINIQNQVQAGGLIQYNLDFCRYVQKGTDIEVNRFIIPKDKSLTNPIELSSNPSLETLDGIIGCRTSEPVKIPIEISAPAGEYKLLIRGEYCIELAFLRRCINVEQYSDYFMIDKPSIPSQLSVIQEQLEAIRIATRGSDTSALGNVRETPQSNAITPRSVPQQPTAPNTSSPQQTPAITVPQPPPPTTQPNVLDDILNTTRNTVDGLLNTIGIR